MSDNNVEYDYYPYAKEILNKDLSVGEVDVIEVVTVVRLRVGVSVV